MCVYLFLRYCHMEFAKKSFLLAKEKLDAHFMCVYLFFILTGVTPHIHYPASFIDSIYSLK